MDVNSASVLWYRRSVPQGKVRRRVQDLRIPSSSYFDVGPTLDLSHNEDARLAADSLLSQGLDGYYEVLNAEGEVDFLSELDKIYILQNGRESSTADYGESECDNKDLESLSAGSQSATQCPTLSTDSDPTVAGLDSGSLKDVLRADRVLDESNFEVYFQSDSRAAGMKDLVREFIRKATTALAIVMDSFSDVELLCDLLEASKKRSVSVHLLLDQLNLSLFISMWHDLKLDSKHFPNLSVRSVDGQTYCAKTGRKLTGQITESFIISDWTEVLTGSYSFSWLSWQVHRSFAVHAKGSAVRPFHLEFHRLHSSSKPVPGFVTYITGPHTLLAQSDNSESKSGQSRPVCHRDWGDGAKKAFLSGALSPELDCSEANHSQASRREGSGAQMHEKPPQLHHKMLVPPGSPQTAGMGNPRPEVGTDRALDPLGVKNPKQIQSQSNPLAQTSVSYIRSKIPTAENKLPNTASATYGHFQSPFRSHPNLEQQGTRDRLLEPLGFATGQRRQWYRSLNFKAKVDVSADHPRILIPTTSQRNDTKTGLLFAFGLQSGHVPARSPVKAQLPSDSQFMSAGAGTKLQPHTSASQRPNWTPGGLSARPRPMDYHSSTYRPGHQAGWRPFNSTINSSLGRSQSMTERRPGGLDRAGLNPNMTRI